MIRQAIIDKEGYVKSLQQLQDDLNTAVQLSLPSKEQPYSKVGVLFVSWENDDLNVGPLEQELAQELKNCYQYDIDFIKLKSDPETVGSSLVKALNAHVDKYARKGGLAIVIYNGHITGAENECLLAGNLSDNVTINWYHVRGCLEVCLGDVLLVMDACYSAATAIGSRVELLAAAAKDAQSSAQPEYSLTRALINCLSEQAGRPATVAYIHGKMLQDAERHKFSTTPIHAIMNRKPSITLTRLGHSLPYQIPISDDAELRVLITTKISHATQRLNKEEWRRYLTSNLPSFVEEVEVEIKAEGLFNSNSDVLLLSMPIYIYNVLKALGPYSFTALIASPNRLLKDPFLTNSPPGPNVGRSQINVEYRGRSQSSARLPRKHKGADKENKKL